METKWLIWSIEHTAWWGPNTIGYVANAKDAGIYPYSEAVKIITDANIVCKTTPNETMVLYSSLDLT